MSRRQISQLVAAEKRRLSELPAEELRKLPEHQSIRRFLDGTLINISIWHHHHPRAGELIVAQAFCPWLPFFPAAGRMVVDGLVVRRDGRITSAEDRDLWDYT